MRTRNDQLTDALALAFAMTSVDLALSLNRQIPWMWDDRALVFALGVATTFCVALPFSAWAPRVATPLMMWLTITSAWWSYRPNTRMLSATFVASAMVIGVAAVASAWPIRRIYTRGTLVVGVVALTASAVWLAVPTSRPTVAAAGPNVLLVTLDTTRADRINHEVTPGLMRLAERGTRYTQAIATAPQTGPSHLTLHTGLWVHEHGVFSNGVPIGDRTDLLARRFRAAGYQTGGFVSAFPVHHTFGFEQGFDVFDDDFGRWQGLHGITMVRWYDMLVRRNVPRERQGIDTFVRAERWLNKRPQPWFAWVHFYDPHAPYEGAADIENRPTSGEPLPLPTWWPEHHRQVTDVDWLIGQYNDEITQVDALLQSLLMGLPANTVIAVVGDHGESLGEHDIWFDHGDDLFEPALRVPLLFAGPGVNVGASWDCVVSTRSVAPTLLTLAGIETGGALDMNQCVDSVVWASTVAGRHANPPLLHAQRDGTTKFLIHETQTDAAYDLVNDPSETNPITIDAMDPPQATEFQGADLQMQEALKALGYFD
jgi:arylsulfatase A-like enzyme